jgi:hypothetical protein
MSPSLTHRRGRIYRYYVGREATADGYDTFPVTSVPAADVRGRESHLSAKTSRPALIGRLIHFSSMPTIGSTPIKAAAQRRDLRKLLNTVVCTSIGEIGDGENISKRRQPDPATRAAGAGHCGGDTGQADRSADHAVEVAAGELEGTAQVFSDNKA